MQRVLRELDSEMLAIALKYSKEEVKEKFFRNMSKRASSMLEEDMEDMERWVTASDIENAKQLALDIYDDLTRENKFDEAWAKYKNLKDTDSKKQDDYYEGDHIVLAFRGTGTASEFVSVYLFDKFGSAEYFCHYLNELKQDKGLFFYAKQAEQMIEYETTKPLLISFDQIINYNWLHGEYNSAIIIREALKKIKSITILQAFKGMDKRSRMFIMQSLPTKTTDEINEIIQESDRCSYDISSFSESHKAQQRIMDAINRSAINFRQGKYKTGAILMD